MQDKAHCKNDSSYVAEFQMLVDWTIFTYFISSLSQDGILGLKSQRY